MEKISTICLVCGQELEGIDWDYGKSPIFVNKYFGSKNVIRMVCWHCVNKLVWQNAKQEQ